MGYFHKLPGKETKADEKKISPQDAAEAMIANAEIYLQEGKSDMAFSVYRSIVQSEPNAVAQYNLGSLYAQGLGVKQDFLEGAYWFHQAFENGDKKAGKLRAKCMMDYIHQGLEDKRPGDIFMQMLRYAVCLYPREDSIMIANREIFALAQYHMEREEYAVAALLFREAAEFGNDGESQNRLGLLYNLGMGVKKNDLVSLYWFDRAAENRVEAAAVDRNGILNAYKTNCSQVDFCNQMEILADCCAVGIMGIPKDAKKAVYWRNHAKGERTKCIK